MNTPQRIFYGSIESGTMWDSEQQAKDYHFQARYHDFPIIELVERTPVVAAAPDLLKALEALMPQAPSRGMVDEYDRGVWDNAAAVIAKATGESA